MKTIYINRDLNKRKVKLLYPILILGFLLLLIRIIAPSLIEVYLNERGAKDNGLNFHVTEIDLKVLKGEIILYDFTLFNNDSQEVFMRIDHLVVESAWNLLVKDRRISLKGDNLDFTLSGEFLKDAHDFKEVLKNKVSAPMYKEIDSRFHRMNIRQIRGFTEHTLLNLRDVQFDLNDLVLQRKSSPKFHLSGRFEQGGSLMLDGALKPMQNAYPWTIEGRMKGITATTLEQLANDEFPFEIPGPQFDAVVNAQSVGDKIAGTISSSFRELKVKEDMEARQLNRSVSRALNLFFEKAKVRKESINLTIPFTLRENFMLDLRGSLERIR